MKGLEDLTENQRSMIKDMMVKAKELFKKDLELRPMCFLMNYTSSEIVIVPIMSETVEDKDMSMAICKKIAKGMNAEISIILMEVWYLQAGKNDPSIREDSIPSEHKERREGFNIMIETKKGTYGCIAPILRGESSATFNSNVDFTKFDRTEGRFTGIVKVD